MIRLGASCWGQHTDWPHLLEAGIRADRLGYDSLWTWDHLHPPIGDPDGPIFEGWLTITAWAQATSRIRVGLMVGANTFRNPALVAKMATTLDHVSRGRAVLGIGAAWYEEEHTAFGLPFGSGPGERLRWLAEALPIMRGMLAGERTSSDGPTYPVTAVRNDPPPIQRPLPILVGGAGERVTLRLMAEYADAVNFIGGLETVRRKERILLEHCDAVDRDPASIERTTGLGSVIIRDSREEAERVFAHHMTVNGRATPRPDQPVGTPEDVVAYIGPFLELGYRHVIGGFSAPYDEESMTRLAGEVRTGLAQA